MNRLMRAASTSAAILACMGNLAGCAEKPQERHSRYHALRCISITSIGYKDKIYKLSADLNYSLDSFKSATECVKLLGSFDYLDRISFIFKRIDASYFERFAFACAKGKNLFLDDLKRPENAIVNPSYANFVFLTEKCNLRLINQKRQMGLNDEDLEDLGFFMRQLSMVKKRPLGKPSSIREEPWEGAIIPKLGTQPQFVSAISGEFDKSPEQTAFFMGIKVEDAPEILCGIVQDFNVSDQVALNNNLSACLFDVR
jgi:hypothetical protein